MQSVSVSMVNKLSYYVRKSTRIGLRNVLKIGYMRVRFTCMNRYWRYRILQGRQKKRTHDQKFTSLQPKRLSYIKSLYDTEINNSSALKQHGRTFKTNFLF